MSIGESIRLQRLFDGGQNVVVVAMDHGLYNGPRPGFENLAPIVDQLRGADAILLPDGSEAPEGIVDGVVTSLVALHDIGRNGRRANSRADVGCHVV